MDFNYLVSEIKNYYREFEYDKLIVDYIFTLEGSYNFIVKYEKNRKSKESEVSNKPIRDLITYPSDRDYDIQIRNQIDDVLRANNLTSTSNLSNLTNQQLINMIDDIEDMSLNVLENWKPSKLN